LADIHHHWNISLMPPLISSFSLPVLQAVRKLSPHAMLGLLVDQWFPDWEEISNQLNCISVNANFHILDAEKVKRIKLNNKLVLSYTVNTFIQARELFSWGVDAVFSDDPSKILK
jgi:glycerophosphoryl diester phosphodiesterase